MMVVRHTNHGEYDGRPIPADVLGQLQRCCVEQGITVLLTPDETIKQKVGELVVRADAIEFADPAFREELGHWIGQGVFGTSWLVSKIGKLAVTYMNIGGIHGQEGLGGGDGLIPMPPPEEASVDRRHQPLSIYQLRQRQHDLAARRSDGCGV